MRAIALAIVLCAAPASAEPDGVTEKVSEHKGSDVKKPPAAAGKLVARVQHAVDKDDAGAFLAILPGKVMIDGHATSKAELKAAIAKAGGLDAYLVIGKDDDWQVGERNDGGWMISRGEPTMTSTVVVAKVHGSWAVKGIVTAAGTNDTIGVGVASTGGDDAAKPKSSVKLGAPQVKGKRGAASVKKALAAHASDMRDCYDTAVKESPKLAGSVTITFTIGADGKVTASSGSGVDDDLANCVAGVIDGISFSGKGTARVKVAATFARKGS